MTGNSSSEQFDVLAWLNDRALHTITPAPYAETIAYIERLVRVAEAANALSRTSMRYSTHHELVSEPALVTLESALDAAGYGMTEAEFEEAM